LEAVEMAVRAAMHQAGAACLTQLLQQEPPAERSLPCPCGQTTRYRGMRGKPILTAVGEVQMLRPYYLPTGPWRWSTPNSLLPCGACSA
jgi:hypothetical protein